MAAQPYAAAGMLVVSLDTQVPPELAIGTGTALFLCGWCVSRAGRVAELEFVVDGEAQPVAAHGMPRIDVFRALHPALDPYGAGSADPGSADDPGLHGYACGFWGTVRVRPAGRDVVFGLRARLDDGSMVETEIGRSAVVDVGGGPVSGAPSGVAVCMATYNPDAELVRRQLDSIRAQTYTDWTCVISDDCSEPARFAELQAIVGDDPRFVVSRSARRLGFYGNFERALSLAPAGAAYVALADQDDRWHTDKLATLVAAIGGAQLVYSDARLVRPDGTVTSDTYWVARANNHADITSLLVANAVSGSASLLRRDLLGLALPFPPAQFAHFHDHWLGLCALARGEIAYVDRPLYDYIQHAGAALGHAAANQITGVRERLSSLRRDPADRVRVYRGIYFVDAARLTQFATILLLREPSMAPAKRRALETFLAADTSLLAAARLWLRGAREYVGRPETLGAERGLAYAFAWRRLLRATARERAQRRGRLDAVPPPDFAPAPGRVRPPGPVRDVAEKIAPLRLHLRDDGPPRINVLVPTIDLAHLFGGYIGKFNLARRLAERGARVRLVTVDPVGPLPADWRARVA
ncbi:MAG: hypothetical protein QOF76_341, partial [Solirubrobacteraceae bacterium]|nr:hypothetical protein [Solirubrobacteraceae bacterium]